MKKTTTARLGLLTILAFEFQMVIPLFNETEYFNQTVILHGRDSIFIYFIMPTCHLDFTFILGHLSHTVTQFLFYIFSLQYTTCEIKHKYTLKDLMRSILPQSILYHL